MAHSDLAQQTLVEHTMLAYLMEGLRHTLAWKVEGGDFARKLSTLRFMTQSFQRHLERVLALEEYDGYMELVVQTSPQLGKAVDALRQEHETFRKAVTRLVHRFEHVSPTEGDVVALLCEELRSLLEGLDAHNKKEADLMQEAFGRDGGGEG